MVKTIWSIMVSPTTLVIVGWLSFIFGQTLDTWSWLRVTLLLVARALPQFLDRCALSSEKTCLAHWVGKRGQVSF